jgi:glycerol-3-phosphate acyltransferase PlsY
MLALALCLAYLLGSFPTGVVMSRALAGDDVRAHGSGNPGASNVARTYGMRLGIAVGATDILKGVVPVLLARGMGVPPAGLALVGAAAVIGHDYSVFMRFRGGKGVATTLGMALGLLLPAAVLAMLLWAAVIAVSRYSSLASLVALASLPVLMALIAGPPAYVVMTAGLFLLATWKHRENISRLWNGTERKFQRLTPANGA